MSDMEPRRRKQIEDVLGRALTNDELTAAISLDALSEAQRDVLRVLGRRSTTTSMVYVSAVVSEVDFGDAARFIEAIQNEKRSFVKQPWSLEPGLGWWNFQIPRHKNETIGETLQRCATTIADAAIPFGRVRELRAGTQSVESPLALQAIDLSNGSPVALILDVAVETEHGSQTFESVASVTLAIEADNVVASFVLDTDIYSAVTWTFCNNAKLAAVNAPRLREFLTMLRDKLSATFLSSQGLVPVNETGFAWP